MKQVYIAIGSNLGNRLGNIRNSVVQLRKVLYNLKTSFIIETEAILLDDMPESWRRNYLNMVVSGNTNLNPIALLAALKAIEKQLGREEFYQKWSPRVIDLDILLYGSESFESKNLTIPHKELKNRHFLQHLLAQLGVDGFDFDPQSFLRSFLLEPAIMGIVNVTQDPFSDSGKYNEAEKAIKRAKELWYNGSSVVDLGAQSTRPGASLKCANDEIRSLKPVLDSIPKVEISIDTFRYEVVEWVLKNYKIGIINDVSGSLDSRTLHLIRDSGAKICVMHSLTIPPDSRIILPAACDPVKEISLWGERKVDELMKIGFNLEDIIIDPGVGFGKTIRQNFTIIKRVSEFKKLGVKTLIGHSRKRYISAFSRSSPADRDIETIAISNLIAKDVDYLRVHDVSNHIKALVAQQSIIS